MQFFCLAVRFTPYFAHVKQAWERRNHPNMLFLFYEDYAKVESSLTMIIYMVGVIKLSLTTTLEAWW